MVKSRLVAITKFQRIHIHPIRLLGGDIFIQVSESRLWIFFDSEIYFVIFRRHIASQLSRYLLPRAYRWATGNYILDYEDSVRGYGGLIKSVIIASEVTGLPSYIFLATEQHSHGLSSKFSVCWSISVFNINICI